MKTRSVIVFLFYAVLLTACHRPNVEMRHATSLRQSSELLAIDSLMWTQPDSALTCLLACYDTVQDRHYANLLLAELLYKNDYEQTNRAELLEAVAYYDSVTCPFLAARAHYINGVGYYERDSVVAACVEYLKAAEIMEERFSEKEFVGKKAQFMALAYTHVCGLFSDQYLHEQAIYFGRQSLPYYDKFDNEPRHVAWMLDEIGSQYNMMQQWDSAEWYYNQAIAVLKDTNNLTYRDVSTAKAFLNYTKKKEPQPTIKQLHCLLAQAESVKEYLARCLMIGEIYYQEKNIDSAGYYLNQVFDASDNANSRTLAAQHLQEIYMYSGDTLLMNKFTGYLSQQNYAFDIQSYLHSELTKLQQDYIQEREEKKHQRHLRTLMNWSILFLIALLILVALTRLMSRKRYCRLKAIHKAQQSAIIGRLKQSNRMLRELQERVQHQSKGEFENKESFATTFLEERICCYILQQVKEGGFKAQIDPRVYKKYALSKQDLLDLRSVVDFHFSQFTIRLSKAYPELTNSDIDYCCLHLLGLSDADLSALMQRAYNTISERNSKLKKVFGTKALSSTLQYIAKQVD